jgi:hypothetical protein
MYNQVPEETMVKQPYSPPTSSSYAWKTTLGYLSERPIVGLLITLSMAIGTFHFLLTESWEPAGTEMLRFVVSIVGGCIISFIILYVLSYIDAPRAIRCEMLETIREFEKALSPTLVRAKLSLEPSTFRMPDNGSHLALVKVTNWNETTADLYGVPIGVYHEDDGFQKNHLESTASMLRWTSGTPADRQLLDSLGGMGIIQIADLHQDRETNEYRLSLTYRQGTTKLEKSGRFKIAIELRGKLAGRDVDPIPYAVMLGYQKGVEALSLTKWPEDY